jgi:hypothetical protein
MLTGFHSVVVDVGDFDSAVGDYARMLGQDSDWLEADAERRTRSALFPLANTVLEIRAQNATATAANDSETTGLSGLRLVCDELERFVAQLGSRGVVVQPSRVEQAERVGRDGEEARTWVSALVDPGASRSISVELISDEAGPQPIWSGRGTTQPGTQPGSTAIDPQSAIRALDHVVVFSTDI